MSSATDDAAALHTVDGVEVFEPPPERRRFAPTDLLRFLVGAAVAVVGFVLGRIGQASIRGIESDLVAAFGRLPDDFADAVLSGAQLVTSFVPTVVLVVLLVRRRFAVAALLWPNTARVIRSQVLTVRERAFVEAARVTGCSQARIIFVHIAPSILPLSFLYGSIAVGWAILTEAAASFLGFGDPSVISWGGMLQDAYANQALSRGAYNWFVPPGVCIVLIVLAGFFVSRGYEEILFPRLRS